MEWQPIETAPRDGTTILVVNAKIGLYSVEEWRQGAWRNDEGLTVRGTHWIPLPTPPRGDDGGRG